MKIPRDASRPKLEDLYSLVDEIQTLPFQPEEEEVLRQIIDNAQAFRDHIARFCNPILATEAEAGTQRFYLRKLEGAEVLLTYETNFFRQELHKHCPVAPMPPPILEVSLSTRKPRPTKLQKMLAEYGVDNPDDLPEHAKGKANSLRRKAANAEAAAAAAQAASGPIRPPPSHSGYGGQSFYARTSQPPTPSVPSTTYERTGRSTSLSEDGRFQSDPMDIDGGAQSGPFGTGGPQLHVDSSSQSLEERLLRGEVDEEELGTEEGKSKALEILSRTDEGRKQAEKIWGADVWGGQRRSASHQAHSMSPGDGDVMVKQDEGKVDQMFKEMTNQDDEEDQKKKDGQDGGQVTAETLESERNGMDALLDGD